MSKSADIKKNVINQSLIFWGISTLILYAIGIFRWYENPDLTWIFFFVVPVQFYILYRFTASVKSKVSSYWKKVGLGTLVSFITGVLMIISSFLFTTVFFPDYFDTIKEIGVEIYEEQGQDDEFIEAYEEGYENDSIHIINAISGMVGSTVTGFIFMLLIAYLHREKQEKAEEKEEN